MEDKKISSIDEYILQFPEDVQQILWELRRTIRDAAPEAEEKISYQMPTFYLHGNLVHFAAYKNHIGFYPTPSGIDAFKDELSAYKGAKGSVQFPINEPVPFELIRKIVEFRVRENISLANEKIVISKKKKTEKAEAQASMGGAIYNPQIKLVLDSFLLKIPVVVPGKMFGFPAYYVNRKLFACVYGEGVGVKVPFELADELIGTEGIIPFIPMGRKRMKEWIQLNRAQPEDYIKDMKIFETSIEYVKMLQ